MGIPAILPGRCTDPEWRKPNAAGSRAAFPSPATAPKSSPETTAMGGSGGQEQLRGEAALLRMEGKQPPCDGEVKSYVVFQVRVPYFYIITSNIHLSQGYVAGTKR